jgi:hypothetical protein
VPVTAELDETMGQTVFPNSIVLAFGVSECMVNFRRKVRFGELAFAKKKWKPSTHISIANLLTMA